MKTIGPNKNQLIIKIDQDTTSAGGMADDLAEGYGLADDSIVLWSCQALKSVDIAVTEIQKRVQTYNQHSEVQSVWTTDQSNSDLM